MTQTIQLSLPGFDGPLDKLLELAIERRLPIEDLAIAQVATQLASHFEGHGPVDLDLAGEAISGGARLLALKSSRVLLHRAPEEEEVSVPVRHGLIAPAELRDAAAYLREMEGHESAAPLAPPAIRERRIEPRQPDVLIRAWEWLEQRTAAPSHHMAVPAFVRIEVAVSGLLRRLKTRARLSFRRLVRGSNRNDVVIQFLAVLELLRMRQATVAQDSLFADITVEYIGAEGDAEVRAG
jgi:segregation and condensation protein A